MEIIYKPDNPKCIYISRKSAGNITDTGVVMRVKSFSKGDDIRYVDLSQLWHLPTETLGVRGHQLLLAVDSFTKEARIIRGSELNSEDYCRFAFLKDLTDYEY